MATNTLTASSLKAKQAAQIEVDNEKRIAQGLPLVGSFKESLIKSPINSKLTTCTQLSSY